MSPPTSVLPARLNLNNAYIKEQTWLISEDITGILILIYSLACIQVEITDETLCDIPCLCWWVQKDQKQLAVIVRLRESCN